MRRGAKPTKAKVNAKASVAHSSPKNKGSRVRDFEKRLAEALEQQTATAEILRVISRSQTDVQPIFDTIVRSAAELCHAAVAAVFVTDGRMVHLPANYGSS